MKNYNDVIRKFSCFLIQKVSSNGSLVLRSKTISFEFTNKNSKKIVFDYKSITNTSIQTNFKEAITNYEISVGDVTYNFSGVHDVQVLNDMINLRKKIITEPKIDYGFINQDKNKVAFTDLNDPNLLYSCMIPATLKQIKEQILSKKFFSDVYISAGNMNVNLEEWTQKNGYEERTIYYNKLLVVPIFGKKLLNISELQRLFEMQNKIGINVISDLGNTPFADCFDPQVQLIFEDKGNAVEFLCKMDIVWSKNPAVKSIIQNQTVSSTKEFYTELGNELLHLYGAEDESIKKEDDEVEKYQEKFSKTRKMYKIAIISLIVILIVTCHLKYRKKYVKNRFLHFVIELAVLCIFFLLLMFF